MPTSTVFFVDTSVLLNLLSVPGNCEDAGTLQEEFKALLEDGAKFVLPITALIETGNTIAQCNGDRRAAADRFVTAITAARNRNPPWTVRDVEWNTDFIDHLVGGGSTGRPLIDHFSDKTLGGGDLAILVERDQFKKETAFKDVRIWTLDKKLSAHS